MMIPLSVPNLNGREWILVKKCLDTNWVSSAGSFVREFEEAICKYTKAKHAIACVNGTSGLFLSLKLAGVKAGDEVIVPTLTFIAPVNVVKYLMAEPVFMDCDGYLNLDVNKLDEFFRKECRTTKDGLRNKRSGRIIRAIIPVHIFGNPCDMEQIMRIARRYGLKVVEDATESLGSYYTKGVYKNRFTGTIGDFGVYSFNGNKIITTGGGGMIVTNNKAIAEKANYLVNQAKDDAVRSLHHEVGYNLRLTNIQAALGLAQLEKIEEFIAIKKKNYELYKNGLRDVGGVEILSVPENTRPNHWFYPMLVDENKYGMNKDMLMKKLAKMDIETRPVWHLSHLQKPYIRNQAYKIKKALSFCRTILNLPCSTDLKKGEIYKVIFAIRRLKR